MMKLHVGLLGQKASTNFIQLEHRRTAIEYALAGINKHHDAVILAFGQDAFSREMEGTMRNWVIETLYQAAYLREYHLWEKDCKAYFAEMAARNQATWSRKPKNALTFPEHIKISLEPYGIDLPGQLYDALETMRKQVNVMKHEDGLEIDHFITEADYMAAMAGLEGFWELLMTKESYSPTVG